MTIFKNGDASDAYANKRGLFLSFFHLASGLEVNFKAFVTNYSETFPGWEIIELDTPEFMDVSRPNEGFLAAKNWYLPNINQNDSFNQHIIDYALDWVGNYKETYFDINCLVVDEKNVLMLGENHSLYKKLEGKGITVHVLPFRARTFWDGGLHCITLDLYREGIQQDYFGD